MLLTCDDGLLNVVTEMLPVTVANGAQKLLFVTGTSASESASMLWYENLYLWLKQGTEDRRTLDRLARQNVWSLLPATLTLNGDR